MFDKEDLNYVISVLKGENVYECRDWYAVSGFLSCHKISGLFYNRALKGEVFLPDKIRKKLREDFFRQKMKVELLRKELVSVTDKLADVKYSVLKGSVLSNIYYPAENDNIYEDGERVSNDIDLLVRQEDIAVVSELLKEMEFEQGIYDFESKSIRKFSRTEIVKRRMNRGEIAPFVKLTENAEFPFVEIDINFSLGNVPGVGNELLTAIVESSEIRKGKIPLKAATDELFFLHLIMHQYKESELLFMAQRNKDFDLYKLADIYYLIQKNFINYNTLEGYVRRYGVEQETGTVLEQVGEVFEDEKITELSKKYSHSPVKIKDYENKKIYVRTASVSDCIREFSSARFLKEVKNDR